MDVYLEFPTIFSSAYLLITIYVTVHSVKLQSYT